MNPHNDIYSDPSNKKYQTTVHGITPTSESKVLEEDERRREQESARLLSCCTSRRFFVTEQGYMGLSFPETRVGDRVCVFPGLEVPFIVRPDGDYYLLVGEAYVQGLMDGEAMQDLDAGLVLLQTFELH
jgi:hypothetical protein